jgi:hypothetical protein
MRSKCSWESYRMQVAKKNKRKKNLMARQRALSEWVLGNGNL